MQPLHFLVKPANIRRTERCVRWLPLGYEFARDELNLFCRQSDSGRQGVAKPGPQFAADVESSN